MYERDAIIPSADFSRIIQVYQALSMTHRPLILGENSYTCQMTS